MDLFSRRLRARLDHLRLSQAEVERRTGFHAGTLRKFLAGSTNHLPHPDRLVALCRTLGVTPEQLLGLDELGEERSGGARQERRAEVERLMAGLDEAGESRLRFIAALLDLVHDHGAASGSGREGADVEARTEDQASG